ncbi:MAG: redoxin domain-containing protein [Epsilonproteobacteria bacterium]|nr:redoxin domain-containing protein [Campylobacterota bacterium]
MRSKIKAYLKEIIMFVAVMFLAANALSYYRSMSLNEVTLPQEEFKLIDGRSYRFSHAKPLMVHFWGTWCPVCRVEAPNIEFISKRFDVLSVAVNSSDDRSIIEYMQNNGLTFSVLNDKEGALAHRYGVGVFPTTLIYNARGELIFQDVGYTSIFMLYLKMVWASL